MAFKEVVKKILCTPVVLFKAGKAEVEEIKAFQLTDKDIKQGKRFAFVVIAALRAYGVPVDAEMSKIIEKAGAYLIRDIKEGYNTKDNLIIARIIEEYKKA
ncbi:MAG: hypothetical protein NC218_08385 [Acetobacter sp.]|nr:hypothetical protein [Acetobacter sp.]